MSAGDAGAAALRARLRQVISLDPRSLGLFRIGLGLLLLADLAGRAPVFGALYGEQGVFPVHMVERTNPGWSKLFFAYLLDGSDAALLGVAALAAACAAALALGWHTRLACFGSWFLLVSLQTRNPMATSYEDQVLRLLLFFSLFLPLGRRFSLDAHRRRPPGQPPDDTPLASVGSAALIVQFASIYFFSALLKTGDAWRDGSAVATTLSQHYVARPIASWALGYPDVLAFLTHLTLGWELCVGFALLSPLWNGPLRTLAVLTIWAFHAGLAVFLSLGLFPWVMMTGGVALLPPWLWDRLGRPARRPEPRPASRRGTLPVRLGEAVAALAIATVLASNVASLWQGKLPQPLRWLGSTLRLDQSWRMYAPEPEGYDYFYVIPGTLADGRRIDLARGGAPLSFEPPPTLPWRGPTRAWALYLDHTRVHRARGPGLAFAAWLCREWNAAHTGRQRLVRVEWAMERFELDGERTHGQRPLGAWTCGEGRTGFTRPAPLER